MFPYGKNTDRDGIDEAIGEASAGLIVNRFQRRVVWLCLIASGMRVAKGPMAIAEWIETRC